MSREPPNSCSIFVGQHGEDKHFKQGSENPQKGVSPSPHPQKMRSEVRAAEGGDTLTCLFL